MRPRILFLTCVMFAMTGAAGAQTAGDAAQATGDAARTFTVREQPLTLRDALGEALRANPELVALRQQYAAATAAVPESRFLDAPMLQTQIWGWPVTTLNPARTDMYMFMAEQALPGRGKRQARERVAEKDADMSRQQVALRANAILDDVKQAYADLMLARATTDLYAQQKSILEDMADTATVRYASGHSGQHDTVQSIAELARLDATLVTSREQARVAAAKLNALLGRAVTDGVPALASIEPTTPGEADAERLALIRHPEIAMADAAIAREEAELARVRGERRPDFVVGGGYMLQPGGAGAWTAQAGITWPNAPWSRGKLSTQIDAQEKRLAAARAQREVALAAVRRDVLEAIAHLDAARERVRLLQTSVLPHVEHAYDVARTSYASGPGDFAALLDTERLTLSTRIDLVAAQADQARALADLQMATGDIPEN